jgi:uncharacterized protein YkwD
MNERSLWQQFLSRFHPPAPIIPGVEVHEDTFPLVGLVFLLCAIALVGISIYFLNRNVFLGGFASPAAIVPSTLLALTNGDRAANGLAPLAENSLLDEAANLRAQDMAQKGYFSHVTPSGQTPLDFLSQVGYKYQNVGENLGLNYEDAASIEAAWMNSPEHRANLLLPQFTQAGTGFANGTYEGAQATFVVELFATPAPVAVNVQTAPAPEPKLAVVQTPTPSIPSSTASTISQTQQIQQLQEVIAALQTELQALTLQLNQLQK